LKRRTTGLALLLGAGLLGLAWQLTREPGRGSTGAGSPAGPHVESSAGAQDLSEPTRVPDSSRVTARSAELARGRAVEGRVEFPPGRPSAEPVSIVARGKPFLDGGFDEVEVSPDGSFRVVFAPGTRSGSLELRGAHLLADPLAWRAGEAGPFVLRPTLGARLRGTLASSEARRPSPGDEVVLNGSHEGEAPSRTFRLTAPVSAAGEFDFPAVPAASSAALSYDGAELRGSLALGPLAAGELFTVEFPVTPGVVLAGRVVAAESAGLAGLRVSVQRTTPPEHPSSTSTDSSGRFRLRALEPGVWRVAVREEGFLHAELEVSVPDPGDRREDLLLVLARGGALAGRLLWIDGTPIEGHVQVHGEDAPDVHHVRSDEDGRFELTGLAAQRYRVRATASRREAVELEAGVEPLKRTTELLTQLEGVAVGSRELELRFQLGFLLDGRIVDAAGVPVERGSLHVVPVPAGSIEPGLPFSLLRVRDALGRFQLAGLAPGTWRLQASAPEFVDSLPVEVEVPTSGPVELALRRGGRLAGRVVDATGAPVGGAELEFAPQSTPASEWTTSDPAGNFVFEPLAPSFGWLRARAQGHASSDRIAIEVGREFTDEVVLHLAPAGRIEGRTVDLAGQPLPGEYVTLKGLRHDDEQHVVSAEGGHFEFVDLRPGEYVLSAQLANAPARTRVEVVGAATAQALLAPEAAALRVSGVVRFDGAPVAKARVRCGDGESRTDANGAFTLVLPGPGEHTLTVSHDDGNGELVLQWPVEAAEGTARHLELSLVLAHLRGRVASGESGKVTAQVWAEGEDLQLSSWTRCAEDGRYDLRVLPGALLVHAKSFGDGNRAPAAQEVRLDPGQVLEVDFALVPGASLSGRVCLESGMPLAEITVSCRQGGEREYAVTDEYGEFECRGLAPGTWRVEASGQGLALRAHEVVTLAEGQAQRLALTLVTAATLEVRLPGWNGLDPRRLTLLDDAGQVLEGPVAPDAKAIFGPLPRGSYRMRLELAGRQVEHAFEVVDGRGLVLTLDNP